MTRYLVASLPAVQRDLYLARCVRRTDDSPVSVSTLEVRWPDMVVSFASDEAISEAAVEVEEDISIATFTRRVEALLDCGAVAQESAAEWVLKYSAPISRYGAPELVRRLLCDKIAQLDAETGETVGVMKIKRRSVDAGHAKVRLVPAEDSMQVVCRHTSAQGLKAVWKSVLWRLKPQHPSTVAVVVRPCVRVWQRMGTGYADHENTKEWLAEQGVAFDEDDIDVTLPLERYAGKDLPTGTWARFYCRVELRRVPAGKPNGISVDAQNVVEIHSAYWEDFRLKVRSLSSWLGLPWSLPDSKRSSK